MLPIDFSFWMHASHLRPFKFAYVLGPAPLFRHSFPTQPAGAGWTTTGEFATSVTPFDAFMGISG